MRPRRRRGGWWWALTICVLLHVGILVQLGIVSFALIMIGAVTCAAAPGLEGLRRPAPAPAGPDPDGPDQEDPDPDGHETGDPRSEDPAERDDREATPVGAPLGA